jgi:2-oxoglutarate ferredoxin oxidoreductase subunit alpha
MASPFAYPAEPMKRARCWTRSRRDFFAKHGEWYRYVDYDGDGVGYRTLPGTDHPRAAYFTRGSGHSARANYSERSDDWIDTMSRLRRKFETARQMLPAPVMDYDARKPVGIVSFGSNDPAIQEARDLLADQGVEANYLRIRALPLTPEVKEFVLKHDRVYVVENNFDGQMCQLIRMEIAEDTTHMQSLALGDTLPMTPRWVVDQILEKERK